MVSEALRGSMQQSRRQFLAAAAASSAAALAGCLEGPGTG
ncbi:twin-arginine translocation signal domain-containing protein, partial [Halobacterium sp. PCN9]|nr:twin-arginine translocation signal domain-containing protein [Halobacterium bonnevillei]